MSIDLVNRTENNNWVARATQQIQADLPEPDWQGRIVYRVKKGDTLGTIVTAATRKFKLEPGQDLKTVASQNNIRNPNIIHVGDTIIIYVEREPLSELRTAGGRPILLASLGFIPALTLASAVVGASAPDSELPAELQQQISPEDFLRTNDEKSKQCHKRIFTEDRALDPDRPRTRARGARGVALAVLADWGEGGGRDMANNEASKIFEDLVIEWLHESAKGNPDIRSLANNLVISEKEAGYTFHTETDTGEKEILRFLFVNASFTIKPLEQASPFWLTNLAQILTTSLNQQEELKVLISLLAEIKKRETKRTAPAEQLEALDRIIASLRETTITGSAGLPKAVRVEILKVLLEHYKNTEKTLLTDPLLTGEILFNMAVLSSDETESHNFLQMAETELEKIFDDQERERIRARIKHRKMGWDPDTDPKNKGLVPSQLAQAQARARRLQAQIYLKEAAKEKNPDVKLARLEEIYNLLLEAHQTFYAQGEAIQLLAVKQQIAEVLLEEASILMEEETTKAEGEALLSQARALIKSIEDWNRTYAREHSWLKQIVASSLFLKIIIMAKQNEPFEIIRAEFDTLSLTAAQKVDLAKELALLYFKLKDKEENYDPCYRMAEELLGDVIKTLGEPKADETKETKTLRAQAQFWLGKIRTAEAYRDKEKLSAAETLLRQSLAIEDSLTSEDRAEAGRVLAENLARQAFILADERQDYQGLLTEAERLLEQAIANGIPYTQASAKLWQAKILVFTRLFSEAEEKLQEAIGSGELKGSELSSAYQTYGDLYVARNNFEEAKAKYRLAVDAYPGNYEAHLSLADVLNWQQRYAEAIAEYDAILGRAKKDSPAYLKAQLGRLEALFREKDDYKELETNPEYRETIARALTQREDQKLAQRALALILEAHEATPEYQEAVIYIANYLLNEKHKTSKLPTQLAQLVMLYVDRARQDQESQTLVRIHLAKALINRRAFAQASQVLAQVKADLEEIEDPFMQLKYELAQVTLAVRQDKWFTGEEVREVTDKILTDPGKFSALVPEALALRVEEYQNEKKPAEIVKLLQPVVDGDSLRPVKRFKFTLDLIDALMALDDYAEAQRRATDLVEHASEHKIILAEAHYRLGEIYRYGDELKAPIESKKHYEQALSLWKDEGFQAKVRLKMALLLDQEGEREAAKEQLSQASKGRSLLNPEERSQYGVLSNTIADTTLEVSHRGFAEIDEDGNTTKREDQETLRLRFPLGWRFLGGLAVQRDDAEGIGLTTPYLDLGLKDVNLGALGRFSFDTSFKLLTLADRLDPSASMQYFRRENLRLSTSLSNEYCEAYGSAAISSLEDNDLNTYNGAVLGSLAWTRVPILSWIRAGIEANSYYFIYDEELRKRRSLALALRLDINSGNLGLPYNLFRLRAALNYPMREYVPASEYFNDETRSDFVYTTRPTRLRGGVGADLNLGFLGIPLTLSGEVNYTNQFSYMSDGIEHNYRFLDYRANALLNFDF